jgi:deoxyribodipyrimidine photo-lyase
MSAKLSIETESVGIVWYRRDLRVADHQPLLEATRACGRVCPVAVTSTWRRHHEWTGPNRQQFLCDSLAALGKSIRALGGRLLFRAGPPAAAIGRLIVDTGARALYYQRDPDPHAQAAERAVEAVCRRLGVVVHAFDGAALHPPETLRNLSGAPYRVFTPFWRKWAALTAPAPVAAVTVLRSPGGLASDPQPTLESWGLTASGAAIPRGGEGAARDQRNRDFPGCDGTSRLSQDLRFGLLSMRTVFRDATEAMNAAGPRQREGLAGFVRQLAWRDFYHAILHHFPEVLATEFNPRWRGLPWAEPDAKLAAWQQGRTGFPIVDAGLRELLATGHMHNRTRMITAMFLTKDLRYDWRLGEVWFMRHLTDGDTPSNNGGWQWSAGTGADAAPYFRIQNPWSQTARYDPQGSYIRRWVPELAATPAERFLQPPTDGCPIAPDYPLPIVDHPAERLRTLAFFQRHRTETGGQ